jgi:hypothetical protein
MQVEGGNSTEEWRIVARRSTHLDVIGAAYYPRGSIRGDLKAPDVVRRCHEGCYRARDERLWMLSPFYPDIQILERFVP